MVVGGKLGLISGEGATAPLMNAGVGGFGAVVVEEFEVAAFVGLGDFVFEEFTVTTGVAFFGRIPGGASGGEFFFADVEGEGSVRDVELDLVAVLDEGEGAAD